MSRKPSTILTVVASASVVIASLTACGAMTGGDPQPTGGSDSSSTAGNGGLPKNGAPAVQHPIDPSKYIADVCSTMSQSALSSLHVPGPGKPKQGVGGPQCAWHVADTSTATPGDLLQVITQAVTNDETKSGLSAPYGKRAKMQVFQPLGEIDGFPALIAEETDKNHALGICNIAVGVSNEQIFSASAAVKPGGSGDPCDSAKKVAELMAQTIKGGS